LESELAGVVPVALFCRDAKEATGFVAGRRMGRAHGPLGAGWLPMESLDPGSEKLGACPRPMDLQRRLHLLQLMSKPLGDGGSLSPGQWWLRWRQQSVTETTGVFGKHRVCGPNKCNFGFL
jgi:hypothetical protein